ncbi:hypothetical protein L3073_11100 [Ancylomarina sp. DW003]|nr:hypothetical protein [Ancylomarina sp. DW003]MDE5422755.1 hypothetical protein [Ancylomarina sp. DW003]
MNNKQNRCGITHDDILNNVLLSPIVSKLSYYQKLAKYHRYSYWIVIWIQLLLGFSIATVLLLKLDNIYVAVFSLLLNFILVINQSLQIDKKYKRYRLTELKIESLLGVFTSKFYSSDKLNVEDYIAFNLRELTNDVKKIVSEEFEIHFNELKWINTTSPKANNP